MLEIKKILFPVDVYAAPTKLIDFVSGMARRFGAELHILYVVRAFEAAYETDYIPLSQYEASLAELKTALNTKLNDLVTHHFADYPQVKAVLASGHTAREILKYIKENNIELVIMGTHGHQGLEKVLFGSVAQRVVETSPAPVVTFNPNA
ncbi:MAG: universal stress protein [Deltaproteobacteria bacterium]|nr:universal stress protein [Deltaproteobacteria bacterium]